MNRVVLGSRGSRLALAQVELVRKTLEQLPTTPEIKVRIVRTTGDRRLDISLSHPGPKIDKGLFTKELEEALLSQEIDVAVHSLKDLPTELPRGLELAATLPRHDPVDVLISKTASRLSDVPVDGLVATSSPRRARQIVAHRPDLQIVDIRGNVPTRIVKLLAEDSWDALVLAKAGLERLGYRLIGGRMQFETHQLFVTDLLELLPAPGQGAIGLETRSNDKEIHQFLGQINDGPTWFCTSVEREFLRLLGGGCSLPLGIRTTLNGSYLTCEAIVFDESDKPRFGTVAGEYQSPVAAASELLNRIYEKGK